MIGKTIKSLLTSDATIKTLVANKIFPYVADVNTSLPALVYTIDRLTPEYNKGGWQLDNIEFSVLCVSRDYDSLQTLVSAVRSALELAKTGYSTQVINQIYLTGSDEGYESEADVFFNKLTFKVVVNTY